MNKHSKQVYDYIIELFPDWKGMAEVTGELLRFEISAPETSNVGALFILTTEDGEIYFRNSHPYSVYFTDTKEELGEVINKILHDEAFWVIGKKEGEWVETTLIPTIDYLEQEDGVDYEILSWSGKYDQVVSN